MLIFVFLILYFLSVLLLFIVDSCPKFLCNIEYNTVNASFFHQHNKKNIKKSHSRGIRTVGRMTGSLEFFFWPDDIMEVFGLHPEWAVFRDMWRGFISGRTSNPS